MLNLIVFFALGFIVALVIVIQIARMVLYRLRYLLFQPPIIYPHLQQVSATKRTQQVEEKQGQSAKNFIAYIVISLIIVRIVVQQLGYTNGARHLENEVGYTETIESISDSVQVTFPHTQNHDQ